MIVLEYDMQGCRETLEEPPVMYGATGEAMVGCPLPEEWLAHVALAADGDLDRVLQGGVIRLECDYEGCGETVQGEVALYHDLVGAVTAGHPLPGGWRVQRAENGLDRVLRCPGHAGRGETDAAGDRKRHDD